MAKRKKRKKRKKKSTRKSIKKVVPLTSFSFPAYGVTIEARDKKEAMKKLEDLK